MGKFLIIGGLCVASIIWIVGSEINSWWLTIPGAILGVLFAIGERNVKWNLEEIVTSRRLLKLAINMELAPLNPITGQPVSKGTPDSLTEEDIRNAIKQHLAKQ